MVRIDSTGYSTSSKRGSYSESPIMLGSIGGCELSIPIQESLLRVCVYTYIYICTRVLLSWNVVRATIIHVRCYFNRHRQMGFPCSSSSLPVVNSSFFLFFLFLLSPPSFPSRGNYEESTVSSFLLFASRSKYRHHLHKELNKNHGAVE